MVLQVDYNYTDRRSRDEPTGEVMPLNRDILTGVKMGDKFQRGAAPQEKKQTKKYACLFKWKIKIIYIIFRQKSSKDEIKVASSVLVSGDAELAGLYKPRTQETRQTFEVLLDFMLDALGDNVRFLFLSISMRI